MSRQIEIAGSIALSIALLALAQPGRNREAPKLSGIRTALELIDKSKRQTALEEIVRRSDDESVV
jgi:hypothetical protein